MQLIEVRPLKPFMGTYRCGLSEADIIDDVLVEKEGGVIVKEKVARKRFVGLIPVDRVMTPDESRLHLDGKLPDHIEPLPGGRMVREWPRQRTVMLPPDTASQLISRGLAERVEKVKKAG